jgi:guanine nucleotide-binding protein subunit alpha
MGNICVEEQVAEKLERDRNSQVNAMIVTHMQKEKSISKLLLLGSGESGKSTVFKQIKTLYANKPTTQERKALVPVLRTNAFFEMGKIIKAADVVKKYELAGVSRDIPPIGVPESAAYVLATTKPDQVDSKFAEHLKLLWADPAIQDLYAMRAQFQCGDGAHYVFNRIDEIVKPDFIPNDQDMLMSRIQTTGIIQTDFTIDGNPFQMFDVGGQRSERRKWIHCFENQITAMIFVSAISEYDQRLQERADVKRLDESLNLFTDMANSEWFTGTSMILFLNKKDLFMEKVKTVKLSDHMKGYEEPNFEKLLGTIDVSKIESAEHADAVLKQQITYLKNAKEILKIIGDDGKVIADTIKQAETGSISPKVIQMSDAMKSIDTYKHQYLAEHGMKFLQDLFKAKFYIKNDKAKQIYVHQTCATNTDNVKFVFNSVKNILLQAAFGSIGLLD